MKSEDYWKNTQAVNQDFRKISQDEKQSRKFKIMKQVIVDYIPFNVTPTQINEMMKENNGKLIVKGVLQKEEGKKPKRTSISKRDISS